MGESGERGDGVVWGEGCRARRSTGGIRAGQGGRREGRRSGGMGGGDKGQVRRGLGGAWGGEVEAKTGGDELNGDRGAHNKPKTKGAGADE